MRHQLFMYGILCFLLIHLSACGEGEQVLPQMQLGPITIPEGDVSNTIQLRIALSEPASEAVTALFSTREWTAIGGEDFVKQNRVPLEIPAGASEVLVPIEILGDEVFEPEESFFVVIEELVGATLEENTAEISLQDDDADPNSVLLGPESPLSYPGMELVWRDEFDETNLDGSRWTQEVREDGWFNEELQYYTNQARNLDLRNGNLIIEARAESHLSTTGRNFAYTSARLSSQDKFEFQYGRVDIRAAMPEGQGIWPALWTLGANIDDVSWPACGEIDILEMIGGEEIPLSKGEQVAHNAMHWQGDVQKESRGDHYQLSEGSLHGEYHVYSILWDEKEVKFLIDEIERSTINIEAPHMSEFHLPHFLIMNVAVGGSWPGNPDATTSFPQQMIVDYVRVFQSE